MRAIVAAAVARPKARFGGASVPAPDEDAFTLAVEASDRVPGVGAARIEAVHLVGPFPHWLPESLPDALGRNALATHRYAPGPAGLWAAVEAASARGEPGTTDLILAFDPGPATERPSGPEEDAALAVLAVAEGGGLRLTGREIAAVPSSTPRRTRRREASSSEGRRETHRRSNPIWIQRGAPGPLSAGLAGIEPTSPVEVRSAPSGPELPSVLPIIDALHTIGTGAVVPDSVALVDPLPIGAETITFELTARVAWADPPMPQPSRAPWRESAIASGSGAIPVVISEGAYLPRATYLANRPSRWRLAAEECGACSALTFPIRGECRVCGRSDRMQRIELPRRRLVVEAATTIRPGAQPTEFDHQVAQIGSYTVLVARAHPQVRVTVQLTDSPAGSVGIGGSVDLALRRVYPMEGEWRYGLKAIPSSTDDPSPPDRENSPLDAKTPGRRGISGAKTPKSPRGSREAG